MKSFTVTHTHANARACDMILGHGLTQTPIFMPVGTMGTIKGLSTASNMCEVGCDMMLCNTYHLTQRPGTAVVKEMGGIHTYMNHQHNVLTDSGGFQMVSLLALADITEKGVSFISPSDGTTSMLTPEDSIRAQHDIGADIIMALDDVVHSCTSDEARFIEAMQRTLRWLDRCLDEHEPRKHVQALFAIVQGGLDVKPGGLRDECLKGFALRDDRVPGYAIGGLAGGESKDAFWRVVHYCANRLPRNKPRYLMGVGDPLDLVVCIALGIDMFDCVYPTRTARFGFALTKYGTVNIKNKTFDFGPIEDGCDCVACGGGYSRALLAMMFKDSSRTSLGGALLSQHNIRYMLRLSRQMRQAVMTETYPAFCGTFLRDLFSEHIDGIQSSLGWRERVPNWVWDALNAAQVVVV